MSLKHLVFIVNPHSGVDKQKAIQNAIDNRLDQKKYTYEIVYTQYALHGRELAKQASAQGAYAVVAVGGDGSINDVATGLHGTDTLLAIMPKGSGNGMARTMQIPLDDEGAIEVINRGNVAKMDVGFANEHLFISNSGVAFDALISKKFANSITRGFAMYSWLVTKHMWTYREWEWDITVDGQHFKERAFIISVANGQQFGYNFKIAPNANWGDGWLDLIIIRKFPKILGGTLLLRAMNGSITDSPFVKHYRGKEITISHPKLKLMQTDGDAHPCKNSIHYRIEASAQQVLVP